jgi:Ca2+-binding RTX toxin-like protein
MNLFSDIAHRITFTDFAELDFQMREPMRAAFVTVFQQAYEGSPLLAAALNTWLANNSQDFEVEFRPGSAEAVSGRVRIDPAVFSNARYVTFDGRVVADSFLSGFVHELGHALTGEIDNDSFANLAGGTAVITNEWLLQLDRSPQASYHAYEANYPSALGIPDIGKNILVVGNSYTDGETVNSVILDRGLYNNTGRGGFQFDSGNVDLRTEGLTESSLIIGSDDDNNYGGTDSRDFIHGHGGDDVLNGHAGDDEIFGGGGADQIFGGAGDDRLFGEAGDDRLFGDLGVDLLHGGFDLAVNPLADHEADGYDEARYDGFLTSTSGLGIEIGLTETVWSDRFASLPDFGRAIFVRDLARDGGVDTLISIEHILGTDSDDRFVITSFDPMRIAGADGTGGLRSVDLGDHVGTSGQGGDVLDLSGSDVGVLVDLADTESFVSSIFDEANTKILVKGVERVIGSQFADVIKGKGGGLIEGGDGDDELHLYSGDIGVGGPGADKFFVYTDRLNPDGSNTSGMWQNRVHILDLDPEDEIYVDGVRYLGRTATGSWLPNPAPWGGPPHFELVNQPDENGILSFHKLGLSRNFSYWVGENDGLESLGLLEIAFEKLGDPSHYLTLQISGYEYGEAGMVFSIDYGKGNPNAGNLSIGTDTGINFAQAHVSQDTPWLHEGPHYYFTYDWQHLAERLPSEMTNYAGLVAGLTGGAGMNSLSGVEGSYTTAIAGVMSTSLTADGDRRNVNNPAWQDSGVDQHRIDRNAFEPNDASHSNEVLEFIDGTSADAIADRFYLLATSEPRRQGVPVALSRTTQQLIPLPDEHERGVGEESLGDGSTALNRHSRLSMLQHEFWGGPARVTIHPSAPGESSEVILPTTYAQGPGRDLAIMMAQPGTNDATPDPEIARKLAMIRQDMNSFDSVGVGENDRLRHHEPESFYFYA